jgi:hypothetical protein
MRVFSNRVPVFGDENESAMRIPRIFGTNSLAVPRPEIRAQSIQENFSRKHELGRFHDVEVEAEHTETNSIMLLSHI